MGCVLLLWQYGGDVRVTGGVTDVSSVTPVGCRQTRKLLLELSPVGLLLTVSLVLSFVVSTSFHLFGFGHSSLT